MTTTTPINPADHIGLAFRIAKDAAVLYGGDTGDWLGPAFESLTVSAGTYKSGVSKFSTHALANGKWHTHRQHMSTIWVRRRRIGGESRYTRPKPFDHARENELAADAAPDASAALALRAHMDALPDRHRAVLELWARGLLLREIAVEIGRSHQRVREIKMEGLRMLRELMEGA